jgi:glutaconate CoA-transferase subunit B
LKGGEFVEKLDYLTSPGYMGGGQERDRCGLFRPESGPSMMISTEAVFRFTLPYRSAIGAVWPARGT